MTITTPPGFCPEHPGRYEYLARVQIRRGEGWDVKPEAEELDGKTVRVRYGFTLRDGESELYVEEIAWEIMDPRSRGLYWIAGGDLTDWVRLP